MGADNESRGLGLASINPEHSEGGTSLGEFREVAKVGVSGPNHIGKVLLCGVSDVDTI